MMRKYIAKLNCKSSKPFVMDDTCVSFAAARRQEEENDAAASIGGGACGTTTKTSSSSGHTNNNWMHHPTLCMYVLTKEVATTIDFDVLIHAIRTNTSLIRINIMGNYWTELSVMQQHLLKTVICQAPALQSVGFMDFHHQVDGHGHQSLQTSLLKTIFEGRQKFGQQGLQELELSHVVLEGELSGLSDVLCAHTTLRTVSVWDVDHRHHDDVVDDGDNANNNNNITRRRRSSNDDDDETTGVLQMLVNLQQVENLVLGSFPFEESQIQSLAKAISHPDHQLRTLRLIGGETEHHHDNNGTLSSLYYYDEYLHHPMMPYDQNHNRLTYQSCLALAEMLKVNQRLVDLELTNLQLAPQEQQQSSSSPTTTTATTTRSGLIEMIKSLQHANRTLKSFQLFQRNLFTRHDMTPQENDALVDCLQNNPILERCLPNGTGPAHETVLLQLKLNRYKLRQIHVDVNFERSNIVDLLVDNNNNNDDDDLGNDLDCIYHVLRDNPSMMMMMQPVQ